MLTMKPYESYIDDLCSLSKAGKLTSGYFFLHKLQSDTLAIAGFVRGLTESYIY